MIKEMNDVKRREMENKRKKKDDPEKESLEIERQKIYKR